MTEDLFSLAYEQLSDMECRECEVETGQGEPRLSLSESDDYSLEAEYTCPECSTHHKIEVEDLEDEIKTTITRTDTGKSYRTSSAKSILRLDTHPARDAVGNLGNLQSCLRMLRFNKEQFDFLTENTPDYAKDDDFEGGAWQHPLFEDHMLASIHNYLSSAYTFEKTFKTVREPLPTGEAVESQFQDYHDNSRVIIGLRTYIQHEQLFPFSINPDLEADSYKIRFMVELDDVWCIESDIDSDNPYGYDDHPEEIYGEVDGDRINLGEQIDQHYRYTERLVETTISYVNDELDDEMEDFYDLAEEFSIYDGEEDED